jgi:molybdate transport system ATP-binding protein
LIKIDIKKTLHTSDGKIILKINKEIINGDFLTIFGKSGSGKTTLLRIIAGLDIPDSGKIIVDNETWFDSSKGINISTQKRNIGFVFQDYALFPNMTIRQNLEFALNNKKNSHKIDEILEMMELTNLSNSMPNTISGGQKQRVAVARTLMRNPKILLLDEPLSALDNTMRSKLQNELLTVHKRFGLTSILVSHDISEVFKLSNRVLKIAFGQITSDGSPNSVFSNLNLSGKFKVTGEVISIVKADILFIVNILVNNEIIKITSVKKDIENINIGDNVLVSSKAFNPILTKI